MDSSTMRLYPYLISRWLRDLYLQGGSLVGRRNRARKMTVKSCAAAFVAIQGYAFQKSLINSVACVA